MTERVGRDERGYALIAALWLLVAISAVSLGIGLRARALHRAAASSADEGRARATAEAGIAAAQDRLAHLLDGSGTVGRSDAGRAADPWGIIASRPVDTVALGDASVVVRFTDTGTRINLNRATEEELRRLFGALRIDAGQADRLAQRIMDWRDPDDFRRPRGAERDDYLKAGAPILPANAAFASVAELRGVLGMTPDLYDRVRPYLTVRGVGRVNLAAAERPVLLALPGLGEPAVAVILSRRAGGRPVQGLQDLVSKLPSGPREALVDSLPTLESRVTFATQELDVASEGGVEGSPVRVRAEVLFEKDGPRAFLVWKRVD